MIFSFFCLFETGSHYAVQAGLELTFVAQAGLELTLILLPQPPKCMRHHARLCAFFSEFIYVQLVPENKKTVLPKPFNRTGKIA